MTDRERATTRRGQRDAVEVVGLGKFSRERVADEWEGSEVVLGT